MFPIHVDVDTIVNTSKLNIYVNVKSMMIQRFLSGGKAAPGSHLINVQNILSNILHNVWVMNLLIHFTTPLRGGWAGQD